MPSGGVGLREENGELVAAEPADQAGVAQALAHSLRGDAQELISGGVAERVVDGLEPVEVDREEGAAPAVAARAGEVLVEDFVELVTVGQAGELIVVGKIGELFLGALAPSPQPFIGP